MCWHQSSIPDPCSRTTRGASATEVLDKRCRSKVGQWMSCYVMQAACKYEEVGCMLLLISWELHAYDMQRGYGAV